MDKVTAAVIALDEQWPHQPTEWTQGRFLPGTYYTTIGDNGNTLRRQTVTPNVTEHICDYGEFMLAVEVPMTRTAKEAINTYQRIGNSRVQDTGAYAELAHVLNAAYDQAAKGKGAERHATDKRFEDQPIMVIQELVGSGFALGQAIKKIQESQRMDAQAAQRELLGAINYLAAAYLQRGKETPYEPRAEAVGQAIEDMVHQGAGMLRSGPDSVQHVPREEWQIPVSSEENEDIVGYGDNG